MSGRDPDHLISGLVNELVEMQFNDRLKGLAVAVVTSDGEVETLLAFNNDDKLAIIAAGAILQAQLLASVGAFDEPEGDGA